MKKVMLFYILILGMLILGMLILTGCNNTDNENQNEGGNNTGYFTYMTIIINGRPSLIPIWHSN